MWGSAYWRAPVFLNDWGRVKLSVFRGAKPSIIDISTG